MGLCPPIVEQWSAITRIWCRFVNMEHSRLNWKIFKWSYRYAKNGCKNWHWHVCHSFKAYGLSDLEDINQHMDKRSSVINVANIVFQNYIENWHCILNSERGNSRRQGNKLRTYKIFKTNFGCEQYVCTTMGKQLRSSLAKFRCGSAPIRLETGRYEKLEESKRLCIFCDRVENEMHVLCECELYDDLRFNLYQHLSTVILDFNELGCDDKLNFILSKHNAATAKQCAKYCNEVLKRRQLYSLS